MKKKTGASVFTELDYYMSVDIKANKWKEEISPIITERESKLSHPPSAAGNSQLCSTN